MNKSLWGDPVYHVDYYSDETAHSGGVFVRETYGPGEKGDSSAALARAAELGKALRFVKVIRPGLADNDTLIATFGTDIKHGKVIHFRLARSYAYACGKTSMPGRLRCECGYCAEDWASMDAHHDLAGVPRVSSFWQYPPEGFTTHQPAREVRRRES